MSIREILSLFEQQKFNSDLIRLCDECISQNPNNATLYCNRASAHYCMELYRRCLKDCDNAIQIDPKCLRAYLRKGYALRALQKEQEAQQVWKQASTIPGDIEIHLEIEQCLQGNSATDKLTSRKSNGTTASTQNDNNNTSSNPSNGNGKQLFSFPKDITGEELVKDPKAAEGAAAQVAERGLVQHGTGNKNVDEQIALGYLQVNTGKYGPAIKLFSKLLENNTKLVAAFLGRGTAYALDGKLDQAIADFTSAIQVNSSIVDAWKRRGQARAARGFDSEALSDLIKAVELEPKDTEALHQRGLVYYKQRNFKRAMTDFKKVIELDKTHKLSYNHLGLCLTATGKCYEAIEVHGKAVAIDPNFREAWTNMAQAYKELAIPDKAESLLQKALSIDARYAPAHQLRGFLQFGVGNHKGAIDHLTKAIKIDPTIDAIHLRAVAQHGLGLLRGAVADYRSVVSMKSDHVSWYQAEIALFVHAHLDTPLSELNMDLTLDPAFKEAWCKKLHPALLVKYQEQPVMSSKIREITLEDKPNHPSAMEIIEFCHRFGPKIQLNADGYLPNKRQHAACGLAVLELAQRLRGVWKRQEDFVQGKASSGCQIPHPFGWRDMYDILIRWRQYSEPNDPVWWVDLLSPEQFEEGFGSHTPMITGQTNVVRYYPMFARAFKIMKALMPEQCNIPGSYLREVEDAKGCKDLYSLMRKDFWVVTPCHSVAKQGKILEGTRLTLQAVNPEGYEYSIRTPGTPPRWRDYDEELTYIWDELSAEASKPTPDLDKLSDLILTMTFFWYNFMPLSRGTAAVGYMGLLAMFLANGIDIDTMVPKDFQVDWEGILTPKVEDFIKALSEWIYPARKVISIDHLPLLSEVFPTIREVIVALNTSVYWGNKTEDTE